MANKCADCKYARPQQGNGEQLMCKRFPPSVQLFPSQNPMTGEQGLQVQSMYPPVNADNWCGEFAPWSGDKGY